MSYTHTLDDSYRYVRSGASRSGTYSNSYTGDAEDSRTVAVPDSTTDQLVNFTLDVSQLKAIYIHSTTALTVETNNASTPTDTITLVADKPYIWTTDTYYANLITADITALYLSNSSGSAATFTLEVVHDSTP